MLLKIICSQKQSQEHTFAHALATFRKELSDVLGAPALLRLHQSEEAVGFADWDDAARVSARGTLTPDHVLFTKPKPLCIQNNDFIAAIKDYVSDYHAYFATHLHLGLRNLILARAGLYGPKVGCLSVGTTAKNLRVVDDSTTHTRRALQWANSWVDGDPSLSRSFRVEYWELEQAKLKLAGTKKPRPTR